MFTAAAVVPSPPLLISPLGGTTDADILALRTAVGHLVAQFGRLAQRWIAVGVGENGEVIGANAVGTFAGFGADVIVGLSPEAAGKPDPRLPLAGLIVAALRARSAPDVACEVCIVATDTTPVHAVELGATLRAKLDAAEEPTGLLIVGDGAATLTEKSPGYFDPRAQSVQADLDRALQTGDRAALAALDADLCDELGIAGRAAFQVLAGAFPVAPTVSEHYCGAPFGVGYWAGLWEA